MGGIAAVLRWDGGPVSGEELRRVTAASPHRAPDGMRTRVFSAGAGQQFDLASIDASVLAVAVVHDLIHPAIAGRRLFY